MVYPMWSLILSCHLAVVFPCVGEVTKTNRNPPSYHIIHFNRQVHFQSKQDIVYTRELFKNNITDITVLYWQNRKLVTINRAKNFRLSAVQDEYSLISDEWIYESTCPTRRVEFAEKKMFFSTEVRVPEHFGLCKLL